MAEGEVRRGKREPHIVNRSAGHDYVLMDRFQAGIVLSGTEIKAIRGGRVELRDSFARITKGEAWLLNMHVSPYEQGNRYNLEPARSRKLLLKRREIDSLVGLTSRKGMTMVPTRLYFKRGYAKIELAVAKGKNVDDKRDTLRKKAVEMDTRRGE